MFLVWYSDVNFFSMCKNWLSSLSLKEVEFSSVQLLSGVRLFVTPWTAAHEASLSITNSWSLPKLMSIVSVMPSNHLILCRPLHLLPSIFSSIRVFSNESALRIRWPKCRSFSFSVSPSNEHSGLMSFRMDWLDLLAVQGTRKSLLQHHSSKASILLCSAFFIVQLSHTYMTIGKTIALTRQTFVDSSPTAYFNYCFHSSQTSDATSLDTTCELKLHCPVLWHQFRPIWLWCVFLFMALEFFFLSSLMHFQLYI